MCVSMPAIKVQTLTPSWAAMPCCADRRREVHLVRQLRLSADTFNGFGFNGADFLFVNTVHIVCTDNLRGGTATGYHRYAKLSIGRNSGPRLGVALGAGPRLLQPEGQESQQHPGALRHFRVDQGAKASQRALARASHGGVVLAHTVGQLRAERGELLQ